MAAVKTPYVDRLNPKYADNPNADRKRQQAEAFEALNVFVRKHGGSITSPPGRVLRIEAPKGSELPAKLRELKYVVVEHGSTTRIVGAAPSLGRAAERTYGAPSPFVECDVVEITLSGK